MQIVEIAVLGSGVVGQALATGYARHGHDVTVGTRRAELAGLRVAPPAEAVRGADLVVLAVVGTAAVDLVTSLADDLAGAVLVDATNPLDFSRGAPGLFVGHDDSLGERVQRAAPAARVVKAYNTVGSTLMVDPQLPGGPPSMVIAGDDDAAKQTVRDLLEATGWDVVDVGGISASRHLEAMCMVWVLVGLRSGSWDHAFRLLRG